MFEDSKGNLWFGSDKEGVCKYDGSVYTYFTEEDGLSNNQVRSLYEDSKGNILLGTGTGVSIYNGETISKIPIHKASIMEGESETVWKDEPHYLYFDAGHTNGVLRYDGEILEFVKFPMMMENDETLDSDALNLAYAMYAFYRDNYGKLWFGTLQRGVISYYKGEFEQFYEDENGLSLVRGIFQDANDNLWFGENGAGLYKYDGENLTNFASEHGLTNEGFKQGDFSPKLANMARVWGMEQDSTGLLYFASVDSGVWTYDGETLKNYSLKDGLTSNFVESIMKDSKGRIFVGTGTGEVCVYSDGKFEIF